ncbi:MAG TPA: hypothetical protein VFS22_05145 [Flavisolibacter sp.]|nr:hypothetical protein [Flavisolibacter sp.]
MKTILLLLGTTLFSCAIRKEVQADLIDVELVKIETVQRYPDQEQKLLTWRDENNISYITFEPMSANYKLGSVMKMMIRK